MPNAPKQHRPNNRKRYSSGRVYDTRVPSSQRGYDRQWTKVRDIKRHRNPLCEHCEKQGHLTPMEIVDHIVPVHIAPEKRLDMDNLQSLCRRCHRAKTDRDIERYGSNYKAC